MSLTYRGCKSMIDRRSYASVEDMQQKLDIFCLIVVLAKMSTTS
ncbi:hypothetical protein [Paenalkalicoccus suaedae]|nr:hypothetical protein [Paenalkalicoccus suaedae]